MKTIRRDWLRRQIDAGKVEAKCNLHLTDDYAWDAANNFGTTDWMVARIRHPKFETYINEHGAERDRCIDHDFVEGQMNFLNGDFTGNTGHAYWTSETLMHLRIHSNLTYTLRWKQEKVVKPRITVYPVVTEVQGAA